MKPWRSCSEHIIFLTVSVIIPHKSILGVDKTNRNSKCVVKPSIEKTLVITEMNDMDPDEPKLIFEHAISTNLGEERDLLQWMTKVSKFCKEYSYKARNCGTFFSHTMSV